MVPALVIGPPEWIWIVLIVAVLLFGAKKIPEFARSLGRTSGELQKGKAEIERDIKEIKEGVTEVTKPSVSEAPRPEPVPSDRERLVRTAWTLGIDTEGKTGEELKAAIRKALAKE